MSKQNARGARTEAAIVAGCRALIREGNLRPTSQDLATRLNMSLRSIFQHGTMEKHLTAALEDPEILDVAWAPFRRSVDAVGAQRSVAHLIVVGRLPQ